MSQDGGSGSVDKRTSSTTTKHYLSGTTVDFDENRNSREETSDIKPSLPRTMVRKERKAITLTKAAKVWHSRAYCNDEPGTLTPNKTPQLIQCPTSARMSDCRSGSRKQW